MTDSNEKGPKPEPELEETNKDLEDDRDFHDDDSDEEDEALLAMGEMVLILAMPDAKISISIPSDMGTKAVEALLNAAVEALGKTRVQMN